MKPVRVRFYARVPGLIRLFAFSLAIAAMLSQVAHRVEFEAPDEVMLISAVSATFGTNGTDEEPAGKSADICAIGFSCHAPAMLVPGEIGLPLAVAATPAIFTKAKMYPGQSVDVPLPPPLNRRV